MNSFNTPLRSANADRSTHTQASRPSRLRCALRRMALMSLFALLTGAQQAWGQAVIMNGDYFLTHNEAGTSVNSAATTTFNPSTCLWDYARRDYIRTADSNGDAININNNYLQNNTTVSLGAYWGSFYRGNNNENIRYRAGYANTSYYLRLNGTTWQFSTTNSNNGALYNCTITPRNAVDNTTNPVISISFSNNTITFTHTNLSGTYTPAYTTYNFKDANHQWYNGSDHGTTTPSAVNVNTLSPNYAWSLTANGGGVASINSNTGVLTLSGAPTANITVRLTIGNITPIPNKTVEFTLTRASVGQSQTSTTTLTNPTINPASTGLEFNQNKQFSVSTVTATTATATIPAHTTLTRGGNTYYYYNGTLYTSTDDFKQETTTNPTVTYSWSLTNADNKLTLQSNGQNTTVTHSTQATTDVNATLTVTASAGGQSKTATATVTAYAAISAPSITQSGSTITLATNSSDATIYYTTDGNTPTANSTRYAGPFDLTTSPQTIKAIAIRNNTNATSGVTSKECSLKLPKPVISINSTGLATIQPGDGSPANTAIYYTTNNTTPTALSTTYSAPVQLSALQTIMAIAILNGYDDSDIASDDYVTQGVSGGKVIIDDREDHTWTYYAGVDASVDGGNYNTNYQGKMYSPNPRNVKITYKANGGAVSIIEGDTMFVYYKTLEQGTTQGQYPYKVISNPFSKRPTGKGFGGWKIKEGADYIDGYNDEATLPLDADIVFTNLPYTSVNCTSAEIVLEATWVNLNNIVRRTGTDNYTYSTTGGTYETNILVLQRSQAGTITVSSPCTIMMVEPDGSADYRNNYTFSGNITPNNNGVTKIEFTKWNSSNTLDCNGHNVTVGRGMTTTSQCASYVTGVTGTTSTSTYYRTTYSNNLNYHLKLESGTFTDVSFIAGTEGTAGYVNCNGTSNQVKGTLGNDYDRAKGDNTKLTVSDELFLGYRPTYASGNQNNANFTCWVKSGNLCSGTNVTNTTFNYNGSPNGGYYGDASQVFYVSVGGTQTNIGKRTVYIEGGILSGIAGGIDSNNGANNESFIIRMTGGTVRGVMYGSGAFAASSGIRRFIVTGGTINGWIAAGCNGTDPSQSGGTLPSDTYVYIGGTAHVGNATDLTLNTSSDGNVFGAGSGNSAQATTGQVNNSNVVIADECYIKNNVYGGGNYGYSNATATVYVTGGEVAGSVFGGSNQKQGVTVNLNMTGGQVDKGVYGGSNVTGTISQSVTMNINGGQVGTPEVPANIHGGGYGSDTRVTRNVELTLGKTGQTTPGVTVYGDVYGGSALGYVNGTAATNDYHTYVTLNKGIINGSLYGGGLGNNNTSANVYGPVKVTVNGGSVNKTDANGANGSGAVYGCNNINGAPQRAVDVIINGTDPAPSTDTYALFAVYGGGNKANYTYGTPTVTVNNCDNSIEYVYGGGNAAHITNGNTDVKIYGGNKIGNVFGGGNGTVTAANVSGNTSVNIYGGTIGRVFGGSNSAGTIGGTLNVNVEKNSSCAIQVGSVYSGGNKAASNLGKITVGCMDPIDLIDSLFCGANQADVTGNVDFTMTSGRIGNLFGGNNQSGNVSGTIKVTVNWDGTCSNDSLGNVFGGGNLATFGTPQNRKAPEVSILNGTVSGNVYGGGKGLDSDHTKGQVTGDPIVTIGDNDVNHTAIINGDVYGGGDAGDVEGTPQVTVVDKANTSIGNVYGGGNAADVSGTDVKIQGGTIKHDVFGGGHGDKQLLGEGHSDKAANVTGASSVQVTGGIIDRVFAGSNLNGTIDGNMTLSINKSDVAKTPMKIGEVYGGANMADGRAASIDIGCTGTWTTTGDKNHTNANTTDNRIGYELEGIGYVYGGANQANIGTAQTASNITVGINSGIVANVFGGNNTSGTIYGTITVNIEKDNQSCSWYVGNVFGGGNQAVYSAPNGSQNYPAVNILNGAVSGDVFGGGYGNADDPQKGVVNGNPQVEVKGASASVAGGVYGGGSLAPTVGNPAVTLTTGSTTNIYGGGKAASVTGAPTVNINGGTVSTGVYGGCNTSGTVSGAISVYVNGGTVGSSGTHAYGIFGGGKGSATATGDAVTVTIGNDANLSPTIYGDVYGGSAEGNVNDALGEITKVWLKKGTVDGDVYGGGFGDNGANALVNGAVQVVVDGGTVKGKVFGCNNANGTPKGAVTVTINATDTQASGYALGEVYGGGNMADYSPTAVNESYPAATVVVNGCDNSIEYVYGGGNAADVPATSVTIYGGTIGTVFGGGHGDKDATPSPTEANVSGDVTVNIYGGSITQVFGGSNSKGTISGKVRVNVAKSTEVGACPLKIGEVYGGGNLAAGNAGSVTIGCTGNIVTGENGHAAHPENIGTTLEGIGKVFGGANRADIGTSSDHSDITLNINSGMVANVFGGNNNGGTIYGDITVNIEQTSDGCGWYVGNVYGAGNLASYTGTPTVNVKNGEVSLNVYGGGKGASAVVTGDPYVTIGDIAQEHSSYVAEVIGSVFGGGDAAAVTGNATVLIQKANTKVDKVFGGGNDIAEDLGISGTATVTIANGSIASGVYGGCNTNGSVGPVVMSLTGGQVGDTGEGNSADVYGGGYGSATKTTGNIGVTLNGTTIYGDLYGGSALGGVNASTSNTTTVTLSTATLHGSVFGGGKGDNNTTATSEGNAIVNIEVYDQYLTGIYGGANVRGLVKGNINVNIKANVGSSGDGNSLDIFGGGYGAATNTNGSVTVTIGDEAGTYQPVIYGDIYGGSALGNVNDAAADITTVNFLNGTLHGNLYGGGLGDASNAAKVNGQVVVNISSSTQTVGNCHIDLRGVTIYGCNNTNGSPQDNVTVNIYKTAHLEANDGYAIDQVFGGGNQADYLPENGNVDSKKKTTVHIYGCDNTIRRVFAGGNAAAATGVASIINGGRFDDVFGGGNGEVTAANIGKGGTDLVVHGGSINRLFGGSNARGTITGTMGVSIDSEGGCEDEMLITEFFCGNNLANIGTVDGEPVTINATIGCGTKFGSVYGGCNLATIYGSVNLTIEGGEMEYVYGGSKGSNNQAANITGNVHLIIKGGDIDNVFGGSNINGNIGGSITVDIVKDPNPCKWDIGNVYGASNLAAYTPANDGAGNKYPEVNIKNGTVGGDVFGGGYGASARATSNPQVNLIGGTVTGNIFGGGAQAPVSGSPVVTANYGSVTNIYGGGLGETAIVTGNPSVVISQTQNQTLTVTDVFGGGDAAAVTGNTTVTLTSGSVTRAFGGGNEAAINGNTTVTAQGATIANIYGGGNKAGATQTSVNVSGGSVTTGVYGGSNSEGTITGAIAVSITGGTIGTDATHTANVHGGGYGASTASNGNVSVAINGSGVNIWGDVYGGSALGNVNDATSDETTVTLTSGTIHGSLYGGGLGDANNAALVNGNVNVIVNGGTVTDKVFGANNVNGTPKGAVTVTINGTDQPQSGYALAEVYGGGNQAHYLPTVATTPATVVVNGCGNKIGVVYGGGNAANVPATDVTIWGGTIGQVFGGGHGNKDAQPATEANVTGNVAVKIYGGTISEVFGGSNSKGAIQGTSTVTIKDNGGSCTFDVTDVYGGGNQADGKAGTLNIGCGAVITGNVYGGAKQANVNDNIHLVISGGNLHNVFGGNNISGTIAGTITVDIDKDDTCNKTWKVDNVYGGGNLAAYTAPQATPDYPVVNIINGTVTGNVFGGGFGESAVATGNPHVNLIGGVVTGSIFGGGDAAAVTGNTMVTLTTGSANRAFGGGNQAAVSGSTTVNAQGATIANIYGGGNEAGAAQTNVNVSGGSVTTGVYGGSNSEGTITGAIAVSITGGTIGTDATHTANVHGGGYGASTASNGNVSVTINGNNVNIWGDVYGGSALGNVNNDTTDLTTVTLTAGTIHGSLYGGGLGQKHGVNGAANDAADYAALVNGAVNVIVNGGTVSEAVFGANNANGTPKGNVSVVINSTAAHVAATGSTPAVFALNAVYGGGNLADCEPTATVTINGTSSVKDVYGGGNAAAVTSTNVTVNGGIIDRVFAGGNGESRAANVTNNTEANIHGGIIRQVFGGGNTSGTIGGTMSVTVNKVGDGDQSIAEVYGGGNVAPSGPGSVTIECGAENIGDVYGGANNANISGDIVLNISGGQINRVFGGNNNGGNITGSITVNIDVDPQTCSSFSLNDVYGGGNLAVYSPTTPGSYPAVNVISGTITRDVFGAGKGDPNDPSKGVVNSNPTVTVTGGAIGRYLFGGGDAAAVNGNTSVNINGANAAINTKVFGGGNNAGVSGNTSVILTNGIVNNNNAVESGIYGGCNSTGTIGGNTYVAVTGGTVGTQANHANIHGGGYGQQTAVSGDVTVNIGQSNSTAGATIYGDVYGGSALGTVNTIHTSNTNGAYNKTAVNLYGGTIDGNVYGGGLGSSSVAALVYGDVDVFQYGVALVARYDQFNLPSSGMIFGCNNVNGTPKGHVKVGVYQTNGIADLSQVTTDLTGSQQRSSAQNRGTNNESDHTYEMAAVFGGGNQAAYIPDNLTTGSTEVFINGCDDVSIHSVYGGGNAASTPATLVTIQGAYEIEYVFGGGNGAGTGNPGANVGYHAYNAGDPAIGGPSDEAKAARQSYAYGSGKAKTQIYGGRLHKVFGGSNTLGNVREATVAMLDEISDCQLVLDGIYGGGKSAYMEGNAEIELGCVSGLDEIYGGAEQADVGKSIVLTLTSGHYNKVYGGNNLGGKILGSITVNIEQTGCLPLEIGELYLGGNNAPYSVYGYNNDGTIKTEGTRIYDQPVMNLKSFKSIGTVFGGGQGESAVLAGDPTINVNVATGWVDGQYKGIGDQDPKSIYHATPQDLTPDGVIGTIYGGGNAADVIGNTNINIGNQATVEMLSLAVIKQKIQESANGQFTTGGMIFKLSDDEKSITYTVVGQTEPAMTKQIIQTVNGANITGNVYGGGNAAAVTGSTTINVGPEGTPQTLSPDPDPNPAPIRSNPQQPQQPQSNAATESQQTRTANPTRL